jgi:hypothetical protein
MQKKKKRVPVSDLNIRVFTGSPCSVYDPIEVALSEY